MKRLIFAIFALSRRQKNLVQMCFDFFSIIATIQVSFILRLESLSNFYQYNSWIASIFTAIISIFIFSKLVFFRTVIRYFSAKMMIGIIISSLISSFLLLTSYQIFNAQIPRSVPIIYLLLMPSIIIGPRMIVRYLYRFLSHRDDISKIIIYGAGEAGRQLAMSLKNNTNYQVIRFIDDKKKNQKLSILGATVISREEALDVINKQHVDKICLALPSATKKQKTEIVDFFKNCAVKLEIIPGIDDLLEGRLIISDTRPIQIKDLLGRSTVLSNNELMEKLSTNKSILVTGAGGSIGSELCYQIIQQKPKTLILLECNEFALYKIQKKLDQFIDQQKQNTNLIAILANIQDPTIINKVFETYCIDMVYHAAAYKHVPLIEYNIIEGIKNNVFGTLNIIKAAISYGVANFTLVSTDKAVRPTNIMGATKRVSELICQSLAQEKEHNTLISMVRFGNVLGSSGSVIPKFQEQIDLGGPVTVTHPEVTRYFMSTTEAAQLVIQASSLSEKGGEVFLLDMGKPIKIIDLAKRMIKLAGAHPIIEGDQSNYKNQLEKNIKIQYTGLRPGEKLNEELLISHQSISTIHPRILKEDSYDLSIEETEETLNLLSVAISKFDVEKATKIIKTFTIGYQQQSELVDNYLIEQNSKSLEKNKTKKLKKFKDGELIKIMPTMIKT